MIYQQQLSITTSGRGTEEITHRIDQIVNASTIEQGLCNIFIHHTSASLILSENADPVVRADLERFMQKIAPDGDPIYRHTMEGDDDMPAHTRTMLTESSLTIPVNHGRCLLGTWQGIYLWEHRISAHRRKITITVYS